MVGSIQDYLVRGHQKVIGHYQFLLRSQTLSDAERTLIESRLAEEEEELGALIENVWKGRPSGPIQFKGGVG